MFVRGLLIYYRRAHAGRLRLCVHVVLVVLHMRHRPSVRLWALDINRCDLVGSQRAKNGTGVLKINAHLQPMCLSHPRLPNFNVDLNVPHGGGAHRFIKTPKFSFSDIPLISSTLNLGWRGS